MASARGLLALFYYPQRETPHLSPSRPRAISRTSISSLIPIPTSILLAQTCALLSSWLGILYILLGAYPTATQAAPYSNPIVPQNIPNPFITFYQGYYYFMRSTDPDGLLRDILITRATTLGGLKTGQTKSVFVEKNSLNSYGSPELHLIDGSWYIYYTRYNADWKSDNYESLAVLKGGPAVRDSFAYVGLLTNTTLSADPAVLRFPDSSQLYMVYRCRTSARDQEMLVYSICIAPMVSPTELGPTKVLINATEPWEGPLSDLGYFLETPAVLHHGGKTFLTYSLGINQGLPFGMLTYRGSGDPMSAASWVKTGPHHNVAFHPSANATCHGGDNKFFVSPDDSEVWNVYSVNEGSMDCRFDAHTGAKILGWNADGSPDFSAPGLLRERSMGPSGE